MCIPRSGNRLWTGCVRESRLNLARDRKCCQIQTYERAAVRGADMTMVATCVFKALDVTEVMSELQKLGIVKDTVGPCLRIAARVNNHSFQKRSAGRVRNHSQAGSGQSRRRRNKTGTHQAEHGAKPCDTKDEPSRPHSSPPQTEKECQNLPGDDFRTTSEEGLDGRSQTGASAIRGRWTSAKAGDASRCATRFIAIFTTDFHCVNTPL